MATFEEASRCPKCNEPGEKTREIMAPKSAGLPRGTKIVNMECRNTRCRWYNTGPWMITIREDGTIPDAQDHSKSPKVYVGFEGHDERAAQLIDKLKADAAAETGPNTPELGRRY